MCGGLVDAQRCRGEKKAGEAGEIVEMEAAGGADIGRAVIGGVGGTEKSVDGDGEGGNKNAGASCVNGRRPAFISIMPRVVARVSMTQRSVDTGRWFPRLTHAYTRSIEVPLRHIDSPRLGEERRSAPACRRSAAGEHWPSNATKKPTLFSFLAWLTARGRAHTKKARPRAETHASLPRGGRVAS